MAEADATTDDKAGGRRTIVAGVREAYAKIPPRRRRWMLIVAGAVLLGLVAMVVVMGGAAPWRPVARGMSPEDVEAATKAFDEKKIPYKLADEGELDVPAEQIHEARLALAVQSMPSGKMVGFEVFDESSMGRSAFTEKVNLHRALEGELARTIRHIDGVAGARVHLVIPERRVLKELEVDPSASVVVSLKPGHELTRDIALAIRQLVAGAVERLQPGQVSIVDQHGRMLTRPDDQGIGSGDGFEREHEQETQLEERVVRLLEPMVGSQKVIARVAVDLDTSRVVETHEDFDPNQQVVRSEREQIDRSDAGGQAPAGPPGTASNLPGRTSGVRPGETGGEAGREKSDTIRNYEMDKIVTRKEDPMPRVRKLSVAVLVDDVSETKDGKTVTRPRTPEELAQLSRLVSHAVGLDPARGDKIEVTSAPFAPPVGSDGLTEEGAPGTGPEATQEPVLWERPIFWIAAGGAAFVLLLALIIALARRRKSAPVPAIAGLQTVMGDETVDVSTPAETAADRRARIAELRDRVVALGNEDVHRLAAVFQRWFEEEPAAVEIKQEAA